MDLGTALPALPSARFRQAAAQGEAGRNDSLTPGGNMISRDAVSMFGDETRLVGRLAITPAGIEQRIVQTSLLTRRRLQRSCGHGPDHAPSGSAPRTELVGLHDEPSATVQTQGCDGDLPRRQREDCGDAFRANCAAMLPEEHSDLLAERRRHSPNPGPEDTAAFTAPSRANCTTTIRRRFQPSSAPMVPLSA